jgi:hypothetical protein
MNEILGRNGMNEILGRIKRKIKAKRSAKSSMRLAKLKALLARKRAAKKPGKNRPSSFWSRMSASARKSALAKFLKQNPRLKGKIALQILKKRMDLREDGKVTAPGDTQQTYVPAIPPAPPPSPEPASAPIPTENIDSPAQAAEDEGMSEPLDEAANEEVDAEEKGEAMAKEVSDESSEKDEAAEMTEPTADEAQEQREEMAEDAQEAASQSGGDFTMGVRLGRLKKRLRDRKYEQDAVKRAAPLAGQLHELTGGAIDKKKTLQGVKLLAKAKRGDKTAKKGVKVLSKLAKTSHPKASKAKKAMAQLTVASKVMKRTAKTPYAKKVRVVTKGLSSYSPYQRGLAMIPGSARARYGS